MCSLHDLSSVDACKAFCDEMHSRGFSFVALPCAAARALDVLVSSIDAALSNPHPCECSGPYVGFAEVPHVKRSLWLHRCPDGQGIWPEVADKALDISAFHQVFDGLNQIGSLGLDALCSRKYGEQGGKILQQFDKRGPNSYRCPLFATRELAGTSKQLSPSVLALFHYSVLEISESAESNPCQDHTDYTMLSLIPEHIGRGLELLDFTSFEFRDVTELAPPTEDGQRWVLCFAGMLGETVFGMPSVVHRVSASFSIPRRSCVFFYYPEPGSNLPYSTNVDEFLASKYLPSVNYA